MSGKIHTAVEGVCRTYRLAKLLGRLGRKSLKSTKDSCRPALQYRRSL